MANSRKGKLGASLKPKTKGQAEYIRTIIENEYTFCTGKPGTGKSIIPIGLACQHLLEGKIFKIVIVKPAIEASPRGIGFLRGDYESKIGPYIFQAIEHLKYFLGGTFQEEFDKGNIEFEVLEYLRGRTYDNTFLICDEFQNASKEQIIMAITRLGQRSRMVINGDPFQTDLRVPNSDFSTDFEYVIHKVKEANLEGFGFSELGEADIVRNPRIAPFLRLFE